MIRSTNREKLGQMKAGQDLVVAGYIGEIGTEAIAIARKGELLQWFSEDYYKKFYIKTETHQQLSWEMAESLGATEFEMTGEGGIFTALWTLSATYHKGITIDLRAIPVRQSTIELCERYELTPYRLWSGNCAVMVSDNGWRLAERFKDLGIEAAVIGRTAAGAGKEIRYGGEIGCMERPRADEIYRVIPNFRLETPENQEI